ncbi:cation:proton antiporter [Methanomassiliicoccus luminyensis]|uniref:cation:proton antiporter n=1 Tax=Methanomassiliicoccus luminyensis TaxID=1080712 RepID=UPI00036C479D|nr:cation:proton antiporter [Methanomassiliicoccus luminyensis]
MEAEVELLFNIAMVLVLGGAMSILMKRIKLPTLFGYIVAGMLLGPYIFTQVIVPEETVEVFSSMGIVLLMFYIGLELNLAGLKKIASYAVIVVGIEMVLMVVVGYLLGTTLGLGGAQALFLGVTISCASTAFSLSVAKGDKHFQGRTFQTLMGLHIMEDVGIVIILAISAPMMGMHSAGSLTETLIIIVVFLALTMVLGLAVFPRFVDWVDKHYSGETLFIVALGLAFALSFLSSYLGLSEAIGAFLAGIIISQARCSHSIMEKVEPMKELFMAIFFLSIGLQLDPSLMLSGLPLALVIAVVFIAAKTLSVSIGCIAANFKIRTSFYIAASMAAMGEFTFVTAKIAFDASVIDNALYSSVVGAAVITMVVLPAFFKAAPKIFDTAAAKMPRRLYEKLDHVENVRMEVRRKMDHSADTKNIIKHQVMSVFIDFVIILTVLIVMNVLSSLDQVMNNGIIGDAVVVSLILFVVSVIMIMPAIIHIVKRLGVMSEALANAHAGEERAENLKKSATYRIFKAITSAIIYILLMAVILPLLPRVAVSIPIFELMAGLFILIWMFWDNIEAWYAKLSGTLSKGISETAPEDDDKGQAH